MSIRDTILNRLPGYSATDEVSTAEEHTFDTYEPGENPTKTVYTLDKAPIARLNRVTARVDGVTRDLDDTAFEVRDISGDGNIDSVAFVDPDSYPDSGTTMTVSYVAESVLSRYVGSYDDDIGSVRDRIESSALSKHIESADGKSLDLLGSMFGDVGRRLGRDDDEYRTFLRSIAPTFDATGTKNGIKFVTAAVLRSSVSEIEVHEDFENVAIGTRAKHPDQPITTSSLTELINLATASGVDIYSPLTLYTKDHTIRNRFSVTPTSAPKAWINVDSATESVVQPKVRVDPSSVLSSSVQPKALVAISGTSLGSQNINIGLGSETISSDRTLE